jgi:hypothetical protein
LIFAPEAAVKVEDLGEERRVLCRLSKDGRLRYWVIGDWRCGRQYPVAPTATNWRRELRELAKSLVQDVRISVPTSERGPGMSQINGWLDTDDY